MKKMLSILLCMVLIFSMMPLWTFSVSAATYSGTCGKNVRWSLNASTGVLNIAGSGAMYDFVNYESVPWYENKSYIKNVVIESGITSIGDFAFYYCKSLSNITIPNSVTKIGELSFVNCVSLTSVDIPVGVTSINSMTFNGCSSLTSISIPKNVTTIDFFAFNGCSSIKSITIPASVTNLGRNAFARCSNLKSITVDGNNENYVSQDGVVFNKDKTTIICCPGGKSGVYTIPKSVREIGAGAFYGCENLTEIVLPNTVTSIHNDAFYGCSLITSLMIPSSVTSVGMNSFGGCNKLKNIKVDEDNKYYISQEGVLFNKDKTSIIIYPNGKSDSSYTIPKNVITIEDNAFSGSNYLTRIIIPNSVTTIANSAFYNCQNLASVIIPDSVTKIYPTAFLQCPSSMIIYGSAGSYAEKFAKQNRFIFKIKSNAVYTITVVDTLGQPIKNANVVCNGVSKQTNSQGSATFEHRPDRKYSVTVKQFGYQTYSRTAGDTSLDNFTVYSWETNSELIILKSTSEAKLGISNVFYQNNGIGLKVDIQHRQKIITKPTTGGLINLDDGLFDIVCNAEYSTAIKKYELWQGNNVTGKKIATSTTGNFKSLSAVDFDSDVSVTLYTYDASGHYHTTPLYLTVKDPEPIGSDESSISLGKKTEFEVPNSIPYVGGTNITMDTIDLPIDVIVSDSTLHVGINTDFKTQKKSGESFTASEKATFKSQVKSIKNTISNLKELDKTNIDKKTKNKVESIFNTFNLTFECC